jgi:hypothetical protein
MIVRIGGGQLVDDERSCVACDTYAVAEPYQTTLPSKVDDLRAQARAYARLAEEKTAEADALEAEIETAQPHAFICGGCKSRLPKDAVALWQPTGAWYLALPMGGRLSVEAGSQAEADIIARTLAALDPPHYREPATAGL